MDSKNCQAQKPSRFITLLDRKSPVYRQRSAPPDCSAGNQAFEAIPGAAGRGSIQSDALSLTNTRTYFEEFQDDYQFAD